MTISSRAYHGETDFERIRELLIESRRVDEPNECWGVERWDTARYASYVQEELTGTNLLGGTIRIWEDESGRLVAATTSESPGEIHLQVDAAHRTDEPLLDEMLASAEERRLASRPAGAADWSIEVYADDRNSALRRVLAGRGYRDHGPAEVLRRRPIDAAIPAPDLPGGYEIRPLRIDDRADLEQYCATEIATFGRTVWTPETVRVLAKAASYRANLDLVVVAPNGSHAAFATVWHDAPNRAGIFEPVGTHPDHRRKGLALALLRDGLRRAADLGVTTAYVGAGYGSPANRLYEAAGFELVAVTSRWSKSL